jgi:hypothetical protein
MGSAIRIDIRYSRVAIATAIRAISSPLRFRVLSSTSSYFKAAAFFRQLLSLFIIAVKCAILLKYEVGSDNLRNYSYPQ